MSHESAEPAALTYADIKRIGQPDAVLTRRNAEHWMSLLYARDVSPWFTLRAYRVGMTADALTWIMVLTGVVGAAVMAVPGIWAAIGSVVLIQLYLILDCSDGELARVQGTSSARGVFLDRLGHYVVEAGLVVALGARIAVEGEWLLIALATALGAMLVKVQGDLIDASRAKSGISPRADTDYESSDTRARGLRRLLDLFPLHRVFGAVELSILILAATLIDLGTDAEQAQRVLLLVLAALALVGVPLRLWMIMRSDRLDR